MPAITPGLGQTGWRKHERTPLAGMSSVIVAEPA